MALLLKFRLPSVQRYIFETSSLREIRGASALIEDFCSADMAKEIERHGGIPLYLAAGHGAIYVEDDAKEPAIQRMLLDRIQSASVTLTPDCDLETYQPKGIHGVQQLLDELDEKLEQASPAVVPLPALHSAMQSCKSCQRFPGSYRHKVSEDWVCHACHLKDRRTRQQPLPYWTRFATFLKSAAKDSTHLAKQPWQVLLPSRTSSQEGNWADPFLADDLNQFAQKSGRQGYVALIYADANNLGGFVKERYQDLPTDPHTLRKKLSGISEAIETCMQDATYTAMVQTWPKVPDAILSFQASHPAEGQAPAGEGTAPLERLFPFDILYLGGDDLLFICTTDQAATFSRNLMDAFNAQTKAKNMNLTLSIGLVYAKAHTPMSVLIEHAKQVLKSAKTKAVTDPDQKPFTFQNAIDFSALTETSVLDLKAYRQMMYAGKKSRLLTRPFTEKEFEHLLASMNQLERGHIRPVRLLPVLEACRRSVTQGRVAMQALLARMTQSDRKVILDAWNALDSGPLGKEKKPTNAISELPWRKANKETLTPLGDWLDLAPFLPNGNYKRESA